MCMYMLVYIYIYVLHMYIYIYMYTHTCVYCMIKEKQTPLWPQTLERRYTTTNHRWMYKLPGGNQKRGSKRVHMGSNSFRFWIPVCLLDWIYSLNHPFKETIRGIFMLIKDATICNSWNPFCNSWNPFSLHWLFFCHGSGGWTPPDNHPFLTVMFFWGFRCYDLQNQIELK